MAVVNLRLEPQVVKCFLAVATVGQTTKNTLRRVDIFNLTTLIAQ